MRHDWKRERVAVLLSCSLLAGCGAKILAFSTDGGAPGVPSTGADTTDVFVPKQNGAVEVFVDDARVYWVTAAENQLAPPQSLRSCLKDQCATTEVTYFASPDDVGPGLEVALDGANVYWVQTGRNAIPPAVESCPRSGCGQGPATVISNLDANSIASDGTFLYWTSQQETSVFRCALGSCRATQTALAQTQASAQSLVLSNGYAYWVAADGPASNAIRRVATDGMSPVEVVASGQNSTSSLTVREPYAYFTNSDSVGMVLRCPVAGCPSGPTVVASGLSFPTGVVADDTNAYWINLGPMAQTALAADGSFARCAVGGCGANPTVLASSGAFWNASDHAVAIDDQYVYWVTEGSAGDNVGQYGFPNAAIHRLAR